METRDAGRVVVGVGRTLGGYQALRFAVAEARRRRVGLVAVRAFLSSAYSRGLVGDAPAEAAHADAELAVNDVNLAFGEALGGLPGDVAVEIVARDGRAAPALVSEARESDLLVIGGSGVGLLRRLLHRAAVARYCARRAACPVVIVPPASLARSARPGRLAREVARSAADVIARGAQTDRTT